MAPKSSLKPWLADFLWGELEAVITWKTDVAAGSKSHPQSRFSDDGSNFRSVASPPYDNEVQLIQVLSTGDTVTGIVSDGVTKLKAQLSDAAAKSFEEQAEEELSLEVTGDVFHIEHLTVISTVLGPVGDFVQLSIDGISYSHHFRKTVGQPKPVEEDENIQLLIENIKALRIPQIKEEPDVDWHADALPVNGSHASASSRPMQTQPPVKRQCPGPTLDNDGFEMERGINLEAPMLPLSKLARTGNTTGTRAHVDADKEKQAKLLELLAKPVTAEQPPQAAESPRSARIESDVLRNDTDLAIAATQGPQLHSSVPSSKRKRVVETVQEGPSTVAETPLKAIPSGQKPTEISPNSLRGPSPAVSRAPPSAQPPPKSQTTSSGQSSARAHITYGRIKIPSNQRRLLDQRSSWIPPLPGQQFPSPNVPIELLARWNAEIAARPSSSPSQRAFEPSPQPVQANSDSSDGVSDEDSDEVLSESEWPLSQSPVTKHRIQLPPSSADPVPSQDAQTPRRPGAAVQHVATSVVRGRPQDDLEIEAPKTLPHRESPNKPFGIAVLPRHDMRHPLPKRPNFNAYEQTDEGQMSGHESPHSSVHSNYSLQRQGQRFQQGSHPTIDSQHEHPLASRNDSPASQLQQSLNSPSQSWVRTQARTSSQPHNESPARERQRRVQEFTSAPPAQRRYQHQSTRLQRETIPQRRVPSELPHDERSPVSQYQASHQSSLPRLSASSQIPHEQAQSPLGASQRTSHDSSWQPEEASTQLLRPRPPEPSPARSTLHEAVPPSRTPVDPIERLKLKKEQFMRDCRRGEWLKENYRPDQNGNLKLGNIAALYNHLHIADNKTTSDDFIKVAQEEFPDERITPGMAFTSVSKEQLSSQIPPPVQNTNGSARTAQMRVDWLKKTYRPAAIGKLSLPVLIAVYKIHQASDHDIPVPAMLDAARRAYSDVKVTTDTRFIQLDQVQPNATSSPSPSPAPAPTMTRTLPSDLDGANDQMHDHDNDPQYVSQQTNNGADRPERRENGVPAAVGVNDAPTTTVLKQFCKEFLKIRPGNGNAFVKARKSQRKERRGRGVDVLGWEF